MPTLSKAITDVLIDFDSWFGIQFGMQEVTTRESKDFINMQSGHSINAEYKSSAGELESVRIQIRSD